LKPLYPATGYGYIQMGLAVGEGAYVVDSFHEKPDQARAGLYFKDNKMLWNIGIFVGRAQTFLKEYQTCAPELYKTVTECVNHRAVYAQAAHISIDYAVIEKSSHITVFPASFEWHDVGNLYSFLSLMAQYTEKTNEVVNINGAGNLASTQKKLVACIGVSDLCLVETDDVLLVVHRGRVEEVKKLLVSLRQTHEHML
jgi:mannose-1-phosphate guanylyltransferase